VRPPDALFADPRLAQLYDTLDAPRDDLDVYVRLAADELQARSVLDVGCGTGSLALLLAARGLDVTGLDPAGASVAVARGKPGADRVRWLAGDAAHLPALSVDLVMMTGNVAQALVEDADWQATLCGIGGALRPDGHLVFETRVPSARAWEEWTPARTRRRLTTPLGEIETWVELVGVDDDVVSFRTAIRFLPDDAVVRADSTLRFRDRPTVEADLYRHGFDLVDVRDAPDRPGREWVFVARRR
jgi:SAM-dependent methyltransferase